MKNVIIFTFIFASALIFSQVKTLACGCPDMGESLEQKIQWRLKNDKAIFTGILIEIDDKSEHGDRLIKFRVERFWKGELMEEIILATENERSSCAQPFEKGKSYLIFANIYDDKLQTGGCLPNREISRAADELEILGEGEIPKKNKP